MLNISLHIFLCFFLLVPICYINVYAILTFAFPYFKDRSFGKTIIATSISLLTVVTILIAGSFPFSVFEIYLYGAITGISYSALDARRLILMGYGDEGNVAVPNNVTAVCFMLLRFALHALIGVMLVFADLEIIDWLAR